MKIKRLRWRLIGAQLLVVLVSVITLTLTIEVVLRYFAPANLQRDTGGEVVNATEAQEEFLNSVRQLALNATLVAAAASTLAGLATGVVLTRDILRPLEKIAFSSRRIAEGHYDERVAVPRSSEELAEVANTFNQMAKALDHLEQQRVAQLSNVMHELRSPLTALAGYLEGLMAGLFPPEPATFSQMEQEVRRLSRLVDDLQELARMEAGQISLEMESFDLVPVIERVLTQVRPQAMNQDLKLESTFPMPSLWVYADQDRATQVLVNLVSNAIRYTPEGGQIKVSLASPDGRAEVTVQDTGIGIPPDSLPYIFERFYRLAPARARRRGGSGIGLTISRHLAYAMGGDLTAASPGPNQGSTFRFTLPLASEVANAAADIWS